MIGAVIIFLLIAYFIVTIISVVTGIILIKLKNREIKILEKQISLLKNKE